MSTRPSWIASQGASKCWDGQALPMQQKNRMHHVDTLLLGSSMIHVYSYPYQLNQGVIKFLQLLKLHHPELFRSMACHLPMCPSCFQGVPLTKCGVNAGDQPNVKSLQGATVAALAASTAAKKNKERVIMALLHCLGGKLGIFFEKNAVALTCFFHVPLIFFVTPIWQQGIQHQTALLCLIPQSYRLRPGLAISGCFCWAITSWGTCSNCPGCFIDILIYYQELLS